MTASPNRGVCEPRPLAPALGPATLLLVECALETTTFRGDDDPRLVRAALACSACLSGDVEWVLQLGEWESQVECTCSECGHRRVLALNFQQALRLHLHETQPLPA